YARVALAMTAQQRDEGRRAIAALPGAYSGKIPKRVRRRSPAALAGYELPLGVMGFPGVGWLFAGFPFTASILLMVGPAVSWAIIPVAFSPYGQGPLRAEGWKVELVWLPLSALLSSAALYRAHARRRRLLDGPPPGGHRRRARTPRTRAEIRARYRTRIGVAVGLIGLVLVSLPFVPAVAGVGGSSVQYSYQRFTKEITGDGDFNGFRPNVAPGRRRAAAARCSDRRASLRRTARLVIRAPPGRPEGAVGSRFRVLRRRCRVRGGRPGGRLVGGPVQGLLRRRRRPHRCPARGGLGLAVAQATRPRSAARRAGRGDGRSRRFGGARPSRAGSPHGCLWNAPPAELGAARK